MGLFNNIPTDPPIEVFHLTELFNQDANPSKVNLGVGVYQDENGKTLTLPVVRSVEQQMAQDLTLTKAYLKGTGLDAYCRKSCLFNTNIEWYRCPSCWIRFPLSKWFSYSLCLSTNMA
jgi:aspartate/tyrosine/aromatic aminotransferase